MKRKTLYSKIGYLIAKQCKVPMTKSDGISVSQNEDKEPKFRKLNNLAEFKASYYPDIENAIKIVKKYMKNNMKHSEIVSSQIHKAIKKVKKDNRVKRDNQKKHKLAKLLKYYHNHPDDYDKLVQEYNSDKSNGSNESNNNDASENNDNDDNTNNTTAVDKGTAPSDDPFNTMSTDSDTDPNNNQQ